MSSPQFQKAVSDIKKLKAEPSQDDKLELYGLFKVANGEQVKDGAIYDMKGRAKYRAYKKVVDSGIGPHEAQAKYVELANSLIDSIGMA